MDEMLDFRVCYLTVAECLLQDRGGHDGKRFPCCLDIAHGSWIDAKQFCALISLDRNLAIGTHASEPWREVSGVDATLFRQGDIVRALIEGADGSVCLGALIRQFCWQLSACCPYLGTLRFGGLTQPR